jgi:hypothetical protein
VTTARRAIGARHPSVSYSVAGRRGRKATVVYDPMRVPDPAGALAALLGAEVMVEGKASPWPVADKAERRFVVVASGIEVPPFTAADLADLRLRLGNDNYIVPIKKIGLSVEELHELGRVSGVRDWLAA